MFGDTAMTLAAVDRLIHHSSIFEMNVESYRRKAATARKPRAASDNKGGTGKDRKPWRAEA